MRRVDGQGNPMPDESYLRWILGPDEAPPTGDVYRRLLGSNFVPASAALIRRHCLEELGGYDESLVYEDYDMWLRIAERGYLFAHEPGLLANYRILMTSLSASRACQFSADRIRILKKHDKPNGAQAVVRQRIGAIARRMYVDSCDRNATRRALRSALRVEPSLENLTFWVAATLGLRYDIARRAKRSLPH
jgi:GT2 family glycosyltransferase